MSKNICVLEATYSEMLSFVISESPVCDFVKVNYISIYPNKGVTVSICFNGNKDKEFNFEKLKNYLDAKKSIVSQWFNTIFFEAISLPPKIKNERNRKLYIWEDHPTDANVACEKEAERLMLEGKELVIVTSAVHMLRFWEHDDNPYEIIIVCKEGQMSLDLLLSEYGRYTVKEISRNHNITKMWRAGKFLARLDPIFSETKNDLLTVTGKTI